MADFVITTDLAKISNTIIEANFDEALKAVEEIVAPYKALVVTPETMRAAGTDRARLRKLRSDLDGYRKSVKEECLKPADAFAEKMKPIITAIDAAVTNIDGQIKRFEEEAVLQKLAELHAYFDENVKEEIRGVAEWEKIKTKHPRWANKTYSMTDAQNDIQRDLAEIERSMNALRGYPEPYKSAMIEKFIETYDLSAAINVFTQTKRREATEEELRRREAERKAAQQANAAQAARMASALSNALSEQLPAQQTETRTSANEARENAVSEAPALRRVEFWVEVTPEQSRALGIFLKQNKIRYGALKREG